MVGGGGEITHGQKTYVLGYYKLLNLTQIFYGSTRDTKKKLFKKLGLVNPPFKFDSHWKIWLLNNENSSGVSRG